MSSNIIKGAVASGAIYATQVYYYGGEYSHLLLAPAAVGVVLSEPVLNKLLNDAAGWVTRRGDKNEWYVIGVTGAVVGYFIGGIYTSLVFGMVAGAASS